MRFVVDLATVARYRPGTDAETVRQRYGLDHVVKLASNEYPLPPADGVLVAVGAALSSINRYPDTHARELRVALADHCGTDVERVAVGNGSLELLLLLGDALLAPGREAVCPTPSFAFYRKLCDMHGAGVRAVPLRGATVDLEAMAAAVGEATTMAIICNPNNPTGTYVAAREIERFVEHVPDDVLVVIDEAYNEFVTRDDSQETLELAKRCDNVCVTRTFSKIHGLCALRVGYAICSPIIREAIDTLRQPYNVNLIAQVAAVEALRHPDEVDRRRALNAELRDRLCRGLEERGLAVVPSQANFVLADLRPLGLPDDGVCERLESIGAIVRDGAAFGLPGRARISVGTREEIDFLLEKVSTLAAERRG